MQLRCRICAGLDRTSIVSAHALHNEQALVFSNKDEPSLLLRSVAMHFGERIEFAMVPASFSELRDELHVGDVPAVVVLHKSGQSELFDGPLNAVALSDFLRKIAPESIDAEVGRCAFAG